MAKYIIYKEEETDERITRLAVDFAEDEPSAIVRVAQLQVLSPREKFIYLEDWGQL